MYCNILVTKPFDKCFIYELKSNQSVQKGSIVIVPFGLKFLGLCHKQKIKLISKPLTLLLKVFFLMKK